MATLQLKVSPGAAANSIGTWVGDRLKIRVTAAPEKGKANKAVIKLLSQKLNIKASAITVTQGMVSSCKTVEIEGLTSEELHQKLLSGE